MSSGFQVNRAASITRKEVRHIFRDPFTLGWAFGLPLFFVIFFGYAIDFNVKEVRLVVSDQDNSRASRQLLEVFSGSKYFKLSQLPPGVSPQRDLSRERAKGVLLIEPGMGEALGSGKPYQIQLLLDGADNSTAGIIISYLAGIQQAAGKRLLNQTRSAPVRLQTRFLFNPELSSPWFVVPGLLAVVMGVLAIMLTALTVAREWESGSMELLLSTPVKPLEIILGKLTPYLVLSLLAVAMIYLVARLQFGLPFRGSQPLFLVGVILFLTLCLAQGLLISVVTRQQALAVQLAFLAGLLPPLLLSGFIFPVESMPAFFQYLTMLIPARWFIVISRGLFLKGSGVVELAVPLGMLLGMNLLLVAAALKRFKKDLEP